MRRTRGSPALRSVLLWALLLAAPGRSEDPVESAAPRRTVRAVRVEQGPAVDGRMDDEVWKLAPPGGPLIGVEPVEGGEPSERTEFRVVYDDENLYIGVWCYDSEPGRIVASEMARDGRLMTDDNVAIALDTFHDRRNGYLFRVNPNGAQEDALVTNNIDLNPSWDGIWVVRATVDEKGWYAEVAIPFKTLGFDPDSDTWGFNLSRQIKRKYEEARWSGAKRVYLVHNVAAGGDLIGLEGLKQGLGLQVTPYALGKYSDDRVAGDEDLFFTGGLDVRYSITPNLTASLSYNTDFAETEVDARQINLTRFPLFFPEKREFFLQDAGIFGFGGLDEALIPFFSRRIGLTASGEPVPVIVAAKLTGRIDDFNFGFVNALVDEHNGLGQRNAFVGRVSKNILEKSSVGLIFTHGDPNSENENLLGGADFNYRSPEFLGDWIAQANAFMLGTYTGGGLGSDLAFGVRGLAESDDWYTGLTFYQIGEDFNPALGFVPRQGIRTYQGELTFKPHIESVGWLRRYWISYLDRNVTDFDDRLETAIHSLTPIYLELESGDIVFLNTHVTLDAPDEDFEIHPGIVIPPGQYWYPAYIFGFQTADKRPAAAQFRFIHGEFYDGHKNTYELSATLKPVKHLVLEFGYVLNDVRLPQGDFDTRLAFARIQVNFTPQISWSTFLPYDDLTDTIGLNSRLRWEFRPGAIIYLVVNQNIDRNHGRLRVEQTEVTAKVGMAFRF